MTSEFKPEEKLRRFASDIVAAVCSHPDVLENKIVDVPELSQAKFITPIDAGLASPPPAYSLVKKFDTLTENRSMLNLIKQLQDLEAQLIWGHAPGYNNENVGQEFLNNYCHALLSGPDGPLKCDSPLGAFVLFGPETLYKDHSHAPNEVYLALTGGGEWRVGQHPWQRLDAGQTIYIPSNAVHAIRTRAEPLLTFSFWLESANMDSIVI